ncbi:MAG TPA: DEAD/DEAH box helicase family protein [Candidatus Sulfotelmatobacter sp.]|jgi:type III restriction enzyme|nr:DEAD/DEAH box helicase family protein [Candidatus Sulfotelmatobacter sp.]
MKLKEYQERALGTVPGSVGARQFLEQLAVWRVKAHQDGEWLFDFAEKAWEKAEVPHTYWKKKDGLERPLPNFCLKIPTGGGKTLLAVKTIDLVQSLYLKRQTGLVVWIVPTSQIYLQTLNALKDRDHPYRQQLDIISAGRTLILEKTDTFTPQDMEDRLAVLMLMLPSASRANEESLKMFQDAGAFQAFFPPDEDRAAHEKLLKRIPNLTTFESEDAFGGKQVKTSLGNTIRLLEPLIILDEGHKAYSENAQRTLRNLNPCMIVELSATPPKEANKLVVISGDELHKEEMIKLDLHVTNKSSSWQDTMRAAMERRDKLEEKAVDYEGNSNVYIRPICLIQVERTGKDQRDGKHIHAEAVREYLIGQGVQKDWIAVKSSEINEIKDFDDAGGLLSRDCPIRYIITKSALQEGWDCSFAYVLTVLTNPHSKTALTQLIGRILRQPYARRTHVSALDESYAFCFQRTDLMQEIKAGFKREGLEEMQGKIVQDGEDAGLNTLREILPRDKFKKAAANMVLPAFMIRDGKSWRLVSYEADILSRVDWTQVDLKPLEKLSLSLEEKRDVEFSAGLGENLRDFGRHEQEDFSSGKPQIDFAYAASHLLDIVPNPWVGYEFVEQVFGKLFAKWKGKEKVVVNNLVFILESMRTQLAQERDRLAETVFNQMLKDDVMHFIVVTHDLGKRMNRLPERMEIPQSAIKATRLDGSQFEMNLFDPTPEDSLNRLEREVASFLDEQSPLYFWYRNVPQRGYYVQGWQKSRIFADFIFTTTGDTKSNYRKVFVLETKGLHLKNENTEYKQSVFELCNKRAQEKSWNDLVPAMQEKEIKFEVVFQDEWENRLNELLTE